MAEFDATAWHDFFAMVGGGAAALTGLLFVALSIQGETIAADALLRFRARGVLWSLAGIFVRSALVLMGGQTAIAVAVEIFLVCLVVGGAGFSSILRTARGRHMTRGYELRVIGWLTCYAVEMAGAAALFAGAAVGIYVVGVAITANFAFGISGAWLLMLGPVDMKRQGERLPRP